MLVPASRAPRTPPHFPDDGRAGGGRARRRGGRAGGGRAGGHPQEAALFLELRFKETQDAKLSPRQLWPLRWQPRQPGPLLGGTGEQSAGRGPSPRPGPQGCRSVGPADHPRQSHSNSWKSLAHPPTCVQSAQSPFQGISYSPSSSNGTSSRKSLPPQPGSDAPLSAHTASLGFPHCSPDFPESPPSTRV